MSVRLIPLLAALAIAAPVFAVDRVNPFDLGYVGPSADAPAAGPFDAGDPYALGEGSIAGANASANAAVAGNREPSRWSGKGRLSAGYDTNVSQESLNRGTASGDPGGLLSARATVEAKLLRTDSQTVTAGRSKNLAASAARNSP